MATTSTNSRKRSAPETDSACDSGSNKAGRASLADTAPTVAARLSSSSASNGSSESPSVAPPTATSDSVGAGGGAGAGAAAAAAAAAATPTAAEVEAAKAAKLKAQRAMAMMKKAREMFPPVHHSDPKHHLVVPLYSGPDASTSHRKTLTEIVKGANLRVIESVQQVQLPELLSKLTQKYLKVGPRGVFLFQWMVYGTQLMAMPNVPQEHNTTVTLLKSLINMLNVLTDDIGDEDKNVPLLHRMEAHLFDFGTTEAPPATGNKEEDGKMEFCHFLKTEIWKAAAKLPRFEEFKAMLEYDLRQMLNEKRYSALCNLQPYVINRSEHSLYAPHTMHGVIFLMCDLLASPSVDAKEVGSLRAVYWDASVMANLANCLGTWRREIGKKDWSSPIFPQALEAGLFTIDELNSLGEAEVKARLEGSDMEEKLLQRWYDAYEHVHTFQGRVHSYEPDTFNKQNEAFLAMHLACRGHI